jgi:hypothetical protein
VISALVLFKIHRAVDKAIRKKMVENETPKPYPSFTYEHSDTNNFPIEVAVLECQAREQPIS